MKVSGIFVSLLCCWHFRSTQTYVLTVSPSFTYSLIWTSGFTGSYGLNLSSISGMMSLLEYNCRGKRLILKKTPIGRKWKKSQSEWEYELNLNLPILCTLRPSASRYFKVNDHSSSAACPLVRSSYIRNFYVLHIISGYFWIYLPFLLMMETTNHETLEEWQRNLKERKIRVSLYSLYHAL